MRFTALLHHIYDVNALRAAFLNSKQEASAGVDGQTWKAHREHLEENLLSLAGRIRRGA